MPELDLVVAATVNQNQEKTVLWDMMSRAVAVVGNADDPPHPS